MHHTIQQNAVKSTENYTGDNFLGTMLVITGKAYNLATCESVLATWTAKKAERMSSANLVSIKAKPLSLCRQLLLAEREGQ